MISGPVSKLQRSATISFLSITRPEKGKEYNMCQKYADILLQFNHSFIETTGNKTGQKMFVRYIYVFKIQ